MADKTLEEILNDPTDSPNNPSEDEKAPEEPNDAPPPNSEEGVEFGIVEVGGVLRDKFGNTWQVPGGNVEDIADLYKGNVYQAPRGFTFDVSYKHDPRVKGHDIPEAQMLYLQLVPTARIREYTSRGFVPVLLSEVGVPEEFANTSGSPLDKYHCIGDAVLVKIPLLIARAIKQASINETKRRLKEIEPTKEMMEKARLDGVATKIEQSRAFDLANPETRQGLYAPEEKREN